MERQLEAELMDDAEGVAAYARADFGDSDGLFASRVAGVTGAGARAMLDLGCGPGILTVRLAQALPAAEWTAVDGSEPMIALARQVVRQAGLGHRVTLLQERLQALTLPAATFDGVVSKDLLHHLPDPADLWSAIARFARPGASVCVMDLLRPSSRAEAERIRDRVVGDADPILQQDFFNSLCAAFTVDEVRTQLSAAGLDLAVEAAGDRHMLITGYR